jgi:hypothetical protein
MKRTQPKHTARITAPKFPKRFSWSVSTRARTLPGVTPLTGCGGSDGAPIKWPT